MDSLPAPSLPPRHPTIDDPGRGRGAEDLGTRFRTSGGPTRINVAWHALMEANQRLVLAAEVSGEQWQRITGIGVGTVVRSPVPLHWRIPLFGVRLVALTARALAVHQMVQHGTEAVALVHENYRGAEGAVQRLVQLAMHLSETSLMLEHLLDPEGDKGLVKDWAGSLVVLAGGQAISLGEFYMARKVRGFGPGVALMKTLADHYGLAAYEMGHHGLRLGEQTGSSVHTGDGTYTTYFDEVAEVGSDGDIAVTVVTGDDGEKTYMVHLPGLALDLEDLNREEGRGYLGLVDAVGNDSSQLAEVVEEALTAAGAAEGDTIALSGYSMGGIAAVNLSQNTRLRKKFDLRAIATVGAPGQNRTIPPGTSAVHFQDGRDPVTNILGEAHQETAERLTVHYEHHDPDNGSDGLFGGAHDMGHHQEVIEELERNQEEHLSSEEQGVMDEFAELYEGEAETLIFTTGWEERETPDAETPGEEVFEGKDLDELVEESTAGLDGKEPRSPF